MKQPASGSYKKKYKSITFKARVAEKYHSRHKCRFWPGLNEPGSNLILLFIKIFKSYGHLWCMGIQGRWRILLIDFVQD
ncbi:MAG: hypothetical protein VB135_02550, partial [Burkholderia sp.]